MSDIIATLTVIAIWILACIGWAMNLVKAVGALGDPITGLFVFRWVGIIVAPLGAILGYF